MQADQLLCQANLFHFFLVKSLNLSWQKRISHDNNGKCLPEGCPQYFGDSANPQKTSALGWLGGAPIFSSWANHTSVVYTVTKIHPSLFLT